MRAYKTVTYTWHELFEKVWEKPLLRVAEDIGISDVALGKACRKAGIRLPGRGYWLRDSKDRERPELGEEAQSKGKISFEVLKAEYAIKSPRADLVDRIPVPEALQDPHPLIAQTLKAAKKAKTDNGSIAFGRGERALHIRCSPATLDRALRILDTIIKASEASGCTWKVTDEGKTELTYSGESMAVQLNERISRQEKQRPIQARHSNRPWSADYVSAYPEYEWLPTNQLSFTINETVDAPVRRNWNDAKVVFLEDKIHDIVAHFPVMAEAIKKTRERHEARHRKFEQERAREVELKRQAEKLRLLRKKLVNDMISWEVSTRIQDFCDAVEKSAGELVGDERLRAEKWLEWARDQAHLLNPISSNFGRTTSLKVKVPDWFKGIGPYENLEEDWWTARDT